MYLRATPYGVLAAVVVSELSVCTVTRKGTDLLMMGWLTVPPALRLLSTWPQ